MSIATAAAPVSFTASALIEVKRLQASSQQEQPYLRVGVKGGGCSGMTYVLDFDTKADNDELYIIDGVEVIMSKSHALYLAGITVDYQQGLGNRGFTFQNPNASSTCGCGTSFAV